MLHTKSTGRSLALLMLALVTAVATAQPRYDYNHIALERLNRGLAAVADERGDSVALSWRLLRSDSADVTFDVYCNDRRLNAKPISQSTFFKVAAVALPTDCHFEVRTLHHGRSQNIEAGATCHTARPTLPYLTIALDKPDGGVTPDNHPFDYTANDATVGDVDGDGTYEIILKWEPTNARDNSHEGYTGPVLIDCYRLTGERLWRIDLGCNIRAGAHYTQMMVADFDGDTHAELVLKTADGTRDSAGHVIGDSTADWRTTGQIDNEIRGKRTASRRRVVGRILDGPEYLTVFDGLTGRALHTTAYIPSRGNPLDWGDAYGNRSERYLACMAYLDGSHPSVVMCRGYYTRTVLAAWDWDGHTLQSRWVFDTDSLSWNSYAGQGNHNLRVADVDGDGRDEITYGSMAVDDDGTGLYNTNMGHGDALHLTAFSPDNDSLQVWDVHENKRDGSDFRDARTGRVLFQIPSSEDVGRGMSADIDPTQRGWEMWSIASGGVLNLRGEIVAENVRIPVNSAVWWDGDLLRELLDHGRVTKYDWRSHTCHTLLDMNAECTFNNGTKSNPCLSADIIGDWREEIVVRTHDSRQLRIYTTTAPTQHRLVTLMQDIPYRLGVATENVGYNQPPEPGYYIGER